MRLTFLGATGTVTGSKYLLSANGKNFLVDCGLFQGYKELRLRNWNPLPISPKLIDAVILTHAHIDHSGYLPMLVKNGFTGKIYCSPATFDLCNILLPDSGYLQEEEAKFINLQGYSKHKPALPLYTKEDAENSLKQFYPVDFGKSYKLAEELTFELHHAGHILGASFVSIYHEDLKLLFSGDLGRPHDPIMKTPAIMQEADYLILESTYGNRMHDRTNPMEELSEIINKTIKESGSILIPAFAVGRAQLLLYYMHQLKQENKIPSIPVFLDSPMAVSATELFCQYANEHRLSRAHAIAVCQNVIYTQTFEESQAIYQHKGPKIIISASGMASGGRVLQHLQTLLPDSKNSIIFAGFQAGGTRGDRLVRGEKTIKIYGEMIPVNASIYSLGNLSAHADSIEILEWLKGFIHSPRKVFLVHGEVQAAEALKNKIEKELGWECIIPVYKQEEILN